MFLEINLKGEICSFKGDFDTYTEQSFSHILSNEIILNPRKCDFLSAKVNFYFPYFCFNNNYLDFVVIPASPPVEIFTANNKEGKIIYSDNFFELCSSLGVLTRDNEAINFFINHWTFPTEKTYFKEIKRLVPRKLYQHYENKITSLDCGLNSFKDCKKNDDEIYQSFKQSINYSICSQANKKLNSLFLSGGVDSVLIGLVMNKFSIPFKAYTSVVLPKFDVSENDNFASTKISERLNWDHETVLCNLNDLSINFIDEIVFAMPMSAHSSFHIISLINKMKSDGIQIGFSGQNMDNLYNLGPTSRIAANFSSMASVMRRAFLTDHYFRSMNDVISDSKFQNFLWRGAGFIGARLYNLFKDGAYTQPNNYKQLIYNYKTSNDYIVFTNPNLNNSELKSNTHEKVSADKVRSKLIQYKINNYLMAGPPQVFYQTGRVNNFSSILPYSSEVMINQFKNFSMGYCDILKPKRYVYKYVEELSGEKYDNLIKEKKVSNEINYHNWTSKIINNTTFGQSLKNYIGNVDNPKVYTEAQLFQRYLSYYWYKKIFSELKEIGVEIK